MVKTVAAMRIATLLPYLSFKVPPNNEDTKAAKTVDDTTTSC